LERAVGWGTHLTDAIRKAVAAAAAVNAPSKGQQQPLDAGAAAVVQAACAAAAELFKRLALCIELPAARREVSSMVPKLLQQLLALLGGSAFVLPDSACIAALQLVAALLRCVPSSLRGAAASLDKALQQLVLRTASRAAGSSAVAAGGPLRQQVCAQAALCVALLPAAPGDAAAWSDAARRLLLSSHHVLDHLLLGLESRPLDAQYLSHLTAAAAAASAGGQQQQPGAGAAASAWLPALPWQQQQQQQGGTGGGDAQQQRRQTVPVALLLLRTCLSALTQLLQQPFAVAVPVPGYSLALLAGRLLRFDAAAAVAAGAVPGSMTMFRELLELQPQLQAGGWQLLQRVTAACGQQLPLQGTLLRAARQGLRTVQLSGGAAAAVPVGVRCCIYDTAVQLLTATGLAGVRACAAEVMGCVVLELYGHSDSGLSSVAAASKAQAAARPAKRSRKSGGASGSALGQFDPAAAAVAATGSSHPAARLATAAAAVDMPAQVAALRLLQQLLEAGGRLLPAGVRAHADAIAYHMSQTTADAVRALQQQPVLSAVAATVGSSSGSSGCGRQGLVQLQVAAYRALLASVLVPCGHRPPFLSQAVTLFRQGRASSCGALAGVCQAAAVQCEALLHPRATAVSSVRQYAGMDALPPLHKPLFWSAVAGGGADGSGDAGGAAGPASALANDTAPAPAPASAAAGAMNGVADPTPAAVVVGYPVHAQPVQPPAAAAAHQGGQQQQPQGQQGHRQPQPAPVLAPQQQPAAQPPQSLTLAAAVSAPQQQQQQQQTVMQSLQPVPDPMELEEAGPAVVRPDASRQAGGLPTQQPAVVTPSSADVPAAAASAAPPPALALFEQESSDSEGPLPDIDSGSGDDDDGGSSSSGGGDH
jgi:proline/glutamate/leucine-rich protein 1